MVAGYDDADDDDDDGAAAVAGDIVKCVLVHVNCLPRIRH